MKFLHLFHKSQVQVPVLVLKVQLTYYVGISGTVILIALFVIAVPG